MNTTISNTVNRGYLRKMAQQGRLWVKCSYHYTDDYAFDNADNFGKIDSFKQVHLHEEHSHPLEAEIEAHVNLVLRNAGLEGKASTALTHQPNRES